VIYLDSWGIPYIFGIKQFSEGGMSFSKSVFYPVPFLAIKPTMVVVYRQAYLSL